MPGVAGVVVRFFGSLNVQYQREIFSDLFIGGKIKILGIPLEHQKQQCTEPLPALVLRCRSVESNIGYRVSKGRTRA